MPAQAVRMPPPRLGGLRVRRRVAAPQARRVAVSAPAVPQRRASSPLPAAPKPALRPARARVMVPGKKSRRRVALPLRPVIPEPILMPVALPERPARTRSVVLGKAPPKARYVVPAPVPLAFGQGALSVGIIATGGTSITMVPANLLIGPRADITKFTVVSLDAGSY